MNIVLIGKIGSGVDEIAKRLTDYFRYETPDSDANELKVFVADPATLRKMQADKDVEFVSFFISCGTYRRFRRCVDSGMDEERVLAEIMTEAHRYDSIHVDFTVENEGEDSWASVTEILKRVKDVVDCSHQSSTKLESFQQA